MFIATVLDGYMRGQIIAYAIAPVENTNNWAWFLRVLLKAIDNIDDPAIPFILDKQKGLIAVVQEVFPEKVHGHYAHHLRGNIKTNHGKAVENFFWEQCTLTLARNKHPCTLGCPKLFQM